QHTPLYFFLLHFWMKIFGDSEVAIRSLSVVFGILTVPVVYLVSSKITTKTNSLIVCLFSAVSPLLVLFSAEARMYSMVVLLVMLSLNFLVDFEQKNDKKSLIKLAIVNLLIPYTFVGGIYYNITLAVFYGIYLLNNKKEVLKNYLKGLCVEFVLLIPYFALIAYYAKIRSEFVVRHENGFLFVHFVDVIRNFFGLELVDNIYWPSSFPYIMNFEFTLLVVVPCVYFVYGLIQGCKHSEGFIKSLYYTFFACLFLSVISAAMHINVFTVRYILYLLPPMLILGVIGLSKRISLNHLKVFAMFYILGSIICGIHYTNVAKDLKTIAYRAVRIEADKNGLGSEDLVILPFGADAPYYFRKEGSPRVLPFDFHKQVRNPKNNDFYDTTQQNNPDKNSVIYDSIFSDKGFSDSHYKYFKNNVNDVVKP
ncbi:MAG: glycosyltransferase family 39 protein, partial [Candidatus Gastranaerophilales bacterium]|nr:glycosyltransferase family 39 protein [Candidatus Gastranaerophilales bacterium]